MSVSSFNTYIQQAKLSDTGAIRVAKGTEDQLVNKGTFGHSIATFFRNIGEALTGRTDPSRAERQQQALEGFRQALAQQFGDEVATVALEGAGLDQDGVKLTGHKVIEAADLARAELRRTNQGNVARMSAYLPPGPDQDATPEFARIAQTLRPPREPASFTTAERDAIAERLRLAMDSESALGTRPVGDDDMGRLARKTITQVARLSAMPGDRLGEAEKARQRFEDATYNVVIALEHGSPPERLAARMETALKLYAEMIEAEGRDESGGAEMQEDFDRAILGALKQMQGVDKEIGPKAQKNALSENSPLRAILGQSSTMLNQCETAQQMLVVGRMATLSAGLVQAFSTAYGSVGATKGDDLDRLSDEGGLSSARKGEALQALDRIRQNAPPDPTPHEMLIGGIAQKIDEGTFDARGLTDLVEEHVVFMAQTDGTKRDKALRELAQALDGNTRIGGPERGRIAEAIQAARERDVTVGGRLVEECLVESRSGDVDYRGVVREHLAKQRTDPFEALDILNEGINAAAKQRGQSSDAYLEVRGMLQLAILEARQEILLDRTLGVVTGGLGHEDVALEDRATGLVQSFLRFGQPIYASPGAALDALAGKLSGQVEDPALGDALDKAIQTARATNDWPALPLKERQSSSVRMFADALLGGGKEVRSMDVGPGEGIERFLRMAQSTFDTPREALDALRQDLTSLARGRPTLEGLPELMEALDTAHERNVWPS